MINNKNLILMATLVLLLGYLVIRFNSKYSSVPATSEVNPPASKELSGEEYATTKEKFLDLIVNHDPRVALAGLREEVKTDNALLRSCHALVHEIGRAAYEKYGDFGEAIKYQDEICNSGYLHGVIEAYFSNVADVFVAIKAVCDPYPVGTYLSWECYHGVGHGNMYYTSNNLPRSLELCDRFDDSFAQAACANGVFMENFNTDQKLHPSAFLKADDPLYPCAEQTGQHKNDCYLYAPTYYLSLHKNDYTDALKWCEGAESPYVTTCVQGVGSQAIKENINNPKFIEKVCMSNTKTQIDACIVGMIGLFINHYGSLEPAEELCEQLEKSNRRACYLSIQSSSRLFAN